MITVIHESTPVARKQYRCDACERIIDAVNDGRFTFAEYRKIVRAKRQGWQIQPGQKYVKQFNTDGRDVWTYRAIPEMHELCIEHDLFDDW